MKLKHKRFQTHCYTRDSQEGKTKLLLAKDVFSYRISESKNPDTKEINGYVLPLCLPLDDEFGKMRNKIADIMHKRFNFHWRTKK